MIDWTAGLDVDDDPVAPSTTERSLRWLLNHGLLPERAFDWWLDRRCPSCGLQRFEHAEYQMGGCRAR
jgi:hypothetical protein